MSNSDRLLQREMLMQQRQEKKKVARQWRRKLEEQGLKKHERPQISNCKSKLKTAEEEWEERQKIIEEQLKVFRALLPRLLNRFQKIKDLRDPKTVKHKLTVVLLYGLLAFVFQMASRREANREMSRPTFMKNLKLVFPELETLPHGDTLCRLLIDIEVEEIEATLAGLVRKFIRSKKFRRYLMESRYLIAKVLQILNNS